MLQILSRHHDMFVGYVLSFSVNPDTAQDIVQEFYLKLYDYDKDIEIFNSFLTQQFLIGAFALQDHHIVKSIGQSTAKW